MTARFLSFLGVTFVMVVSAASALAQGTVNFRNNQTDFPTPADRDVYCGDPLVGTNFQARLLYGSDAASLQPATYTTPARFRNVTTGATLAGTWSGDTRTLVGFSPGSTVTLQVQVWDSTGNRSFDEARAAGQAWGVSQVFSYTIPPAGTLTPQAYYMDNFRSFGPLTCVPEPASLALFSIAGLAWFTFLRRRRS